MQFQAKLFQSTERKVELIGGIFTDLGCNHAHSFKFKPFQNKVNVKSTTAGL